jgi:hypothetical protein
MKALEIILRLKEESARLPEVIAPVLANKDTVKVFVSGHPYRLDVEAKDPGWYIMQPNSVSTANIVREAMPMEILKCLQVAPKLRMIAMRRVSESRWLAFPFNISDAQSKGFPIQPMEVFLVNQNLEPFCIISARLWGKALIFDSYVYPPDIKFAESLDKGSEKPPEVAGMIPEMKTVYSMLTDEIEQAKKRTVEGRIQSAVEYLGAKLVGFREFGDGYEVEYRDGGQSYKVRIAGSLRLKSAGICLSGLENQQTLSSCVAVMRKSMSRQHYYEDDEGSEYSE